MTASTGDVLWNGINLHALVLVLYCCILSHVLSFHFFFLGNIAYCITVEYDTNTYSGGELLLSTAVDEDLTEPLTARWRQLVYNKRIVSQVRSFYAGYIVYTHILNVPYDLFLTHEVSYYITLKLSYL